ncbi:MAG: hypothetical protein M0Z77_08230 [Thermoplasmatales archaeon]|jgi:hypothetical protein|nr:hypothetical protein [Candidatus Thermoplasmatota archaeon]MCL6003338.1 hypothetical protein [Candidatus Thermoplasmatota archaeon]MDA8055614.1 hypothetical protein [Thermoplasmatales archaeon]
MSRLLDEMKAKQVSICTGEYDDSGDMYVTLSGTLIDYDEDFIKIKDLEGRTVLFARNSLVHILEGLPDDVVKMKELTA